MLYMIFGQDHQNSGPARQAARPAHLARVQELADAGRLVIAGPLPCSDAPGPGPVRGSLILAEFDSLDDARAWASDDPYVAAGVYASVEVYPFLKVLP